MTAERKRSDVLRKARELIQEPGRWCQGDLAVDMFGNQVSPCASNAWAWCGLGAVMAVAGGTEEGAAALLNRSVNYVAAENDMGTHADVMTMFCCAIAIAEQQEAGSAT